MDIKNRKIIFAVLLLGFSSIAAQIVLLREFLIVFYGNEMSMGYMLSAWLIGTAIGSWLLGGIADKIKNKQAVFCCCQSALGLLFVFSIVAVRYIKIIFGLVPGQIIAFMPMLISSFVILVPLCSLLGFMFAFSCRRYEQSSGTGVQQITDVYILEAIGAILGGILVSFVFIQTMKALDIMVVLGLLNIIAAIYTAGFKGLTKKNKFFYAPMCAGILMIALIFAGKGYNLQARSIDWQWQGSNVLSCKNSIYGNIVITGNKDQKSFFYNGLYLYTIPNKKEAEESVHFSLLSHYKPKNVLLIGGGIGGAVEEILRHDVDKIDYLELDPELIKQAKKHISGAQYSYLQNSKVKIHHMDGRFFVKNTDNRYDCIILNVGDPYTAQTNRYYTVEFFKQIKTILNKQGVFSLALTSSESYISQELQDFLASIYHSLREVFTQVKVIPGDKAYFISSSQKNAATNNYKDLTRRAKQRKIGLEYVRDYYLFNKLSQDKIKQFQEVLQSSSRININHDFHPTAYYYDMVFWASHFRDSLFKKILKTINEKTIWLGVILLSVLILSNAFIRRQKRSFYKQAVLSAVFMAGFAEMSFQIVILLCFQVIYGYVFYKLGLILTAFMIGLVWGAVCIKNILPKLEKISRQVQVFICLQLAVCIYPLILPLIFSWLSKTSSSVMTWVGPNIIFPCLPIIAGFIGGMQFPLANKMYLGNKRVIGKAAGINYGVDLFGACFGALLSGTFLIPILGIAKTCFLVAGLNAVVLIMLFIMAQKTQANNPGSG
ncbi:MAG: fused MFS/spermidine synthase [Candidatus Omnitrophica bacterium]|nr:fused MFS/spermidine synthase [Candidatus Omnitrophota bacterium]